MDFTLDQWYADQQKYQDMLVRHASERDISSAKAAAERDKGPDQIYHPKTDEDYDQIPMGGIFVDPGDGQLYKKTKERESTTRGVEV